MQKIRRICPPVDLQLEIGRLEGPPEREHPAFCGQVIALQQVALLTGGEDIFPCGRAAA